MYIYIDPKQDLQSLADVADDLGIVIYDGKDHGIMSKRSRYAGKRKLTLSLRPKGEQYRMIRDSPYSGRRKVWAVCWHGHWWFMRMIFQLDRTATIQTGRIGNFNYTGLDEFYAKADASGEVNIGSQMYPQYLSDACDCNHSTERQRMTLEQCSTAS